MQASEHLLARLRYFFHHNSRCSTLYRRAELYGKVSSFAQKRNSAAIYFYFSSRSSPSLNTHLKASVLNGTTALDSFPDIVAFFSKPSSLPCHRWQFWSYGNLVGTYHSQYPMLAKTNQALSLYSVPSFSLPTCLHYTERKTLLSFCCRSSWYPSKEYPQRVPFNRRPHPYLYKREAAT